MSEAVPFSPSRRSGLPAERMTGHTLNGAWSGVELVQAAYHRHRFPIHAHPDVHIALIESGRYGFRRDRAEFTAGPGELILLGADEPHDGATLTARGYSYRQLLIPPELWSRADCGEGRRLSLPAVPVLRRDQIAMMLRIVFAADRTGDPLVLDAGLARLVLLLTDRPSRSGPPDRATSAMVRCVLERMENDLSAPWTLLDLAEVVGTSRFALSRAFRRDRGIGLHEWLTDRRLHQARRLLAEGMAAAEAAAVCGFADQSHMTRHFKRVFGVTPGWYAAARTSVQDR